MALSTLAAAIVPAIGFVLAALAAVGIVYQVVVWHALGHWFAQDPHDPASPNHEGVTLLKPLHGAEPRLAENLGSFLRLDHPGPVQMLCGVNDADDAALPVARALAAAHPAADITIGEGPRASGANGKIGNLVAMMPLARHDVLVLSDSDMAVAPDYLDHVLGALARPGVGAVSCLYVGRGDAGAWSRLGAAAISYAMMPSMVLALRYRLSQPCMGSTIALRRATLDAIGGFGAFRDVLADDYAIGAAVRDLGLTVAVPPMLITHACDEASPGALWRHHLRWQVTLRGIVGVTHGGTIVTHALPLALIACAFMPLPGLVLIGLALAVRFAVKARVDALAGTRTATFATSCLADCVEFVIFLASLVAQEIDWRGSRLVMATDGRIQSRR
jgi:ceramide glucosyltransferase